MPYCTASAQHKDLADVAALEQSYEFCIAVWYQPAGLLMQMFITYAPEQRADSNHPPAQTGNTPVPDE